ncbi:hypothetical protein BUALT_Bualt16G0026200 [Buddleja alternifolia]|uniref:Pentatricopeptide repeat-containing protein n=1 Tax=Buddleja alternifolia TaxID=168488 RepID=A0AAV6WA21_9LAMI|nr:hypothetical protein BUALT_Bualt16G0026200 [Buddleja alternifolia]
MRYQWLRLLLIRSHAQSQPHVSQVTHLRSFTSSLLHPRAPHVTPKPFIPRHHSTSSPDPAVDPPKPISDQATLLVDIFAKNEKYNKEIKLDLKNSNVIITHDLILSVLRDPNTTPYVARRVFNWVLNGESGKLSSQSFNWMLGILGSNGLVKECWDLIEVMKTKGYGVSKGAYVRIYERFEKDGLSDDVERLKELYALGSASSDRGEASNDNCNENVGSRISKIVRREVWGDDVEKQLKELDVKFSGDVVTGVLMNLGTEPNKALIFFRWVEESGLFRHDQGSFNAIATVLAREESCEKFWRVVHEMRSKGYEMERETYVNVLERFVKRKMIKNAVELYEFAMIGENKPSADDCIFLLKKIVVGKELDMDLFLKVVKISKANGNRLTNANMDSILKSLTSVGRMNECNRVLEAMEEGGYLPNGSLQRKIAFNLSSGVKTREANQFMNKMVKSHLISDSGTWVSLVKGYCAARKLNEASDGFRSMVENEGPSCGGYALDLLVNMYCRKGRPLDAYKLVSEMVNDKGLSPWNATYKTLSKKLLVKRKFQEALDVMNMMKNQGYPPDLDSFVEYLSYNGGAEDAVTLSQAMTCKRFPAMSVFLRIFEAFLKAGRHSEAQDFLSKCPRSVRNHGDVLNLFCSMKSGNVASDAVVAV